MLLSLKTNHLGHLMNGWKGNVGSIVRMLLASCVVKNKSNLLIRLCKNHRPGRNRGECEKDKGNVKRHFLCPLPARCRPAVTHYTSTERVLPHWLKTNNGKYALVCW